MQPRKGRVEEKSGTRRSCRYLRAASHELRAISFGTTSEHFPVCPWLEARNAKLTGYNGGVPFRIRQFEKADFDTLWRIDQACFDPQLAYSRAEMAFYMRRPRSFTLVAESDGGEVRGSGKAPASILGFILAESRRKSGHIITIDVVAEARRAGVGSALLRAAEEQLLRAGAVAVALETPVNNAAAIRFYKQKWYFVEKTVAEYYSNHVDALIMTKEMARSPVP